MKTKMEVSTSLLSPGKFIHIHTQYGQGIDLTGAVCEILNTTGELPVGYPEKWVGGLTPEAKDTMMVKIVYIIGDRCEGDLGQFCRLRKWYDWTWNEAMLPPEKLYEGLLISATQ